MRSIRVRLSLLAAAVAAVALLPSSAGATYGGATGRVAYDTFDPKQLSTFSIGPHGAHNRMLVRNANDPSWSPDGRRIVFYRDRSIFVARADGTHVHRLIKEPDDCDAVSDPSWSPHGNHISFTATFEEQFGEEQTRSTDFVYTIRANGSHLTRIHKGHGAVWSPRNRRLAFVSGGRIRSIRPNGTHVRILLRHTPGYVGEVDFSPNGRRLVYLGGGPPTDIHILTVRTRRHRRIDAIRLGNPENVAWTPSGKRIAYLHQHVPPAGEVFPPTVMRTIRPGGGGRRDEFEFRPRRWPFNFAWQGVPRR
jgi:Tol biopolymer transport system component